jgi:hypothetical protein
MTFINEGIVYEGIIYEGITRDYRLPAADHVRNAIVDNAEQARS